MIPEILDLIAHDNFQRAQEKLKALIRQYPDKDELYNLYGYCSNRLEDLCARADKDEPPTPVTPEKWQEYHFLVCKMADKGKYKEAANLARLTASNAEIVPVNPDFPHEPQARSVLLGDVARCYFLMDDKENAKRFFEAAVKTDLDTIKNPNSSVRIKYYLKLKNYDEALRLASVALDHPITDDPADKAYDFYCRYKIFKQMGETMRDDLERALHYAGVALRERPLSHGLYFSRAEWFMELGDWVRAYRENAKAVALWPRCCLYQLQAAEIYAHYFDCPKESLKKLELADCAWTIGRDESGVPARKARVYEALGNFQEAEKMYRAEWDVCTRCDSLEDFFTRQKREADKINLRKRQRIQPYFLDRVSERELTALF